MAAVFLLLAGCHSAFVDAMIVNRTPNTLHVIQVDYPSASFGLQTLDPGGSYHYRLKVLGDGPTKITYTDASNMEQHSAGPMLREGDDGALSIDIGSSGVVWMPHLHNMKQ